MRTSIIIKSTSKILSASCVLLMAVLQVKMETTFLEAQFKLLSPQKKTKKRKENKIKSK